MASIEPLANDTYSLGSPTNVWKDISPTTTSVNGLYDHTSIYYNNKMVVEEPNLKMVLFEMF